MEILCPIAAGSGASLVHKMLEERLPNYRVCGYHPNWTLFPPSLLLKCRSKTNPDIIHTGPDYACFFSNPKSKLIITFHNFYWDNATTPAAEAKIDGRGTNLSMNLYHEQIYETPHTFHGATVLYSNGRLER